MFKEENSEINFVLSEDNESFRKTFGRITEKSLKEADAVADSLAWTFGSLVLLLQRNPDYVRMAVEQWLNDSSNKDFKVDQNGPTALLFLYGLMKKRKDWHGSFSKALNTVKEDSVVWQYLYIKANLVSRVDIRALIVGARNDEIQKMWRLDKHYSDTMFRWLKSNKEKLWRINSVSDFLGLFYLVDEEKRLLLLDVLFDKATALMKDIFHYHVLLKILSPSLEKRRNILQGWIKENRFRSLKTARSLDVKRLLQILSDNPTARRQELQKWLNEKKLQLNLKRGVNELIDLLQFASDSLEECREILQDWIKTNNFQVFGKKGMVAQADQVFVLLRFLSSSSVKPLDIFEGWLRTTNGVGFVGPSGVFNSARDFVNFLFNLFKVLNVEKSQYGWIFFKGSNYLEKARSCLTLGGRANRMEQWIQEGILPLSGEHGLMRDMKDLIFCLEFLSDLQEERLEILERWIDEKKIQLNTEESSSHTTNDLILLLSCLSNKPKGRQTIFRNWIDKEIYCVNCRDWNDFTKLLESLQGEEGKPLETLLKHKDFKSESGSHEFQSNCMEILREVLEASSQQKIRRFFG
ncbi:MAG: hypothetical protein KKE46_04225 [Gammaproteobacteria bacterium]|nr:hypothetical protein [Gammaproteobacteria bacterium]